MEWNNAGNNEDRSTCRVKEHGTGDGQLCADGGEELEPLIGKLGAKVVDIGTLGQIKRLLHRGRCIAGDGGRRGACEADLDKVIVAIVASG